MSKQITTSDCLEWLDNLNEGMSIFIWHTDLKFITRIKDILGQYDDEVQAANASYRKWKEERDDET